MSPVLRLTDTAAARALFVPIAASRIEIVATAYLDTTRRVIGMRHTPSARFLEADVPIRAIIGDALLLGAPAIVMAHNHPLGDPTPSTEDIAVTRRIAEMLAPLGIRLVDHLILAGGRWTSFRADGRL